MTDVIAPPLETPPDPGITGGHEAEDHAHGGHEDHGPTGILKWLTSTDHKVIGLSYMITSIVLFYLAGIMALGMTAVIATGGGLLFTGKETGEFIAIDRDTGQTVWQFQTGSGVNAQPITFTHQGRQFVTVLSGLGGVYLQQAREALMLRNLIALREINTLRAVAESSTSRTLELEEETRRDAMTGVYNRAYLDQVLARGQRQIHLPHELVGQAERVGRLADRGHSETRARRGDQFPRDRALLSR